MSTSSSRTLGPFLAVLAVTVALCSALAAATVRINYWPSDSYTPYIPAARQLFHLKFLSQMHELPVDGQLKLTMHGKETLILGIALMQKLLGDTQSLYPNVLLLILAVGVSAVLAFLILERLYGRFIALWGYGLLAGCSWPYMYTLQGAHQPLALMNFFAAAWFDILGDRRRPWRIVAGVFTGFLLFSSPTAALFLPYFLLLRLLRRAPEKKIPAAADILKDAGLVLAGMLPVILLFTLPDPAESFRQFQAFLRFSQFRNNFVIYHNYIYQYAPVPLHFRGAGLSWIPAYGMLILPVLFPAFLAATCYLLLRSVREPRFLLIALLGLSTPLGVELAGVAQFGRNYFSWLPGMVLIVTAALSLRLSRTEPPVRRKAIILTAVILLLGHWAFNAHILIREIFPSRLATTRIHDWLVERGHTKIYVYAKHPRNVNLVRFLNNPKDKVQIAFEPISSIKEAPEGIILVPPITGKSIYQECRLNDFYDDPALTRLYGSGRWERYVAAAFPTLASSRTWTQEEEICTYLDLVLGKISGEDRAKGFAFLLDAGKLQDEWTAP